MPSLQIRDLPADIYEILSARAEREGRSLAQQAIAELRKLRDLEGGEHRRSVVERLRREIEDKGTRTLEPAPEALLRSDRER